MHDLVKHIWFIHSSILLASVALLLAMGSSTNELKLAQKQLHQIEQLTSDWREDWLTTAPLDKLGFVNKPSLPRSVIIWTDETFNKDLRNAKNVFRLQYKAPFWRFESDDVPEHTDDFQSLQAFFDYWDFLSNPVSFNVVESLKFQRRRELSTGSVLLTL